MSEVPVINARQLMASLKRLGFVETRSRGSHRRFEHADGRKTTVPVHRGRDIPKGLLRQIVTIDLGMTLEDFSNTL